ncbi:hypothetical protein NOR_06351 [Metarhizium rileyi]|uniref:Transcription factor n=1 Tax=Metarhizium rileyi (strain RCEF 4871) TaxID=1649241 RepID=A0A167AN34_METRR|nr:hypothetical protein NOR_06351 [Metarhizium rileyi RCEF 4871]
MRRFSRRGPPKRYEILDVTSEVIRDYNTSSPPRLNFDEEEDGTRFDSRYVAGDGRLYLGCPGGDQRTGITSFDETSTVDSFGAGVTGAAPVRISYTDAESPLLTNDTCSPGVRRQTDNAVADLLYFSQGGQSTGDNPQSLQMRLDPMPISLVADYLDHNQPFTPNGAFFEDGIFLPGSAYHELHSTLRQHLIQEVRSNMSTRPATPRTVANGLDSENGEGVAQDKPPSIVPDILSTTITTEQPILSKDEECILWRNWFDEVAPWLDKFDIDRHFQYTLPTLAPSNDHLRYAILALSARQQELKTTTQPTDRSLALYQEAIHLLLPDLASRSTAAIASCVILCVLEMLSCSPKAWQRHLDGCASLMEAVGINGFVGGVDQALFWCFARMDVCGALISSVTTLIPVSHWVSKSNIDDDVRMFRSIDKFTGWANYAVYLTAQVLSILSPLFNNITSEVTNRSDSKFRIRWLRLWKYICDWQDERPPAFFPVMTMPSNETSPFPTIIFSNPAAISGNQLYHTASVLMLQNKPLEVLLTPKPRSVLWHARRICAISISNDHHGAWTNAVQPLWVAGRCMSHPTEHKAILDILERIEKESGWGTKWRQEDLKSYWGDLED